MSTFTASLHTPNVKAPHTGIQIASGHVTTADTGTAGSKFLMCKVPNGAVIVDYYLYGDDAADASQTYKIGTSASPSGIMAVWSNTGVASLRFGGASGGGDKLPVKISLSDDNAAVQEGVWIAITAAVAISESADYTLMVWYTMDGTKGRTTIR